MFNDLRTWALAVFVSGVLLLSFSQPAWADADGFLADLSASSGNLKFGELEIHPGVEVSESYDDNIYNVPYDEKEDFITTVTPGLLLGLGTRHKFEVGYALDIKTYDKYREEDYTDQVGKAGVFLDFPMGVTASFDERYEKTKDPRPEERRLRASHWTNDMDAMVGYLFPAERLSIEAAYSQSYLKYDQSYNGYMNKREDVFGLTIYYRFLPKTSALVEYMFGNTDFFDSPDEDTDRDSRSDWANVGLRWDATARLSGTLKSGVQMIEYDSTSDPNGDEYEDKELWSVSGQMNFKMSRKTVFDLVLNRSIEDTEYDGNLAGNYSGSSHYISTGAVLGMHYKFTPKIRVDLNAGYEDQKYNALDSTARQREDGILTASAGVTYEIRRWLSAGVEYSYYDADSNDGEEDEVHNRSSVTVSVVF